MGLGAWPAVSLSRAREKVAANRALLDGGIDPIDERRREKATDTLAKARAITFDAAAETYIAGNEAKWRNPKNKGQWRSSLKSYASPILGRLPLSDITTDHVVRALRPIWHAKAETAVRVRGRIETVLAFGIAQGWCAEPNVARWHNHLQMILPPRSKIAPVVPHPALPWRDLPRFHGAAARAGRLRRAGLEFTILTAGRSGEARGATWDEIDLDAALWTIPAARMKAHRPHGCRLSQRAARHAPRGRQAARDRPVIFPA